MATKLIPIPFDQPLPKDPRGRKPHKIISPEEVENLISIMSPSTFVPISRDAVGSVSLPARNQEYENKFYMSLRTKEIITIKKWMGFIYGPNRSLLTDETKRPTILQMLGLPPYAGRVLDLLVNCEIQRWYEMYYVEHLNAIGEFQENVAYPFHGYDSIVVSRIIRKYELRATPRAVDNITAEEVSSPPPLKRGSRTGEAHIKINVKEIEELRLSLMKCKPTSVISSELGVAAKTIYNAINAHMFAKPANNKKTANFHRDTIMRLISNGDTTWEYYVRIHALCEKALIKAIHAHDPSFIIRYKLSPTRLSLLFEYNKLHGGAVKLGQAFGVQPEIVNAWLLEHKIGVITAPREHIARKNTAKKAEDVFIDDYFERNGIDPNYNPFAADRVKFNRDTYK